MQKAPRRYKILGLLGKGGFGAVYLAEFSGEAGFSRRVAIKLLTADAATGGALQRLRDEARILGLLDDRAVVSVEPPTTLEGQPAVIMDYVEGVSLRRLLKQTGPLPRTVALEIVREVARVLDKAWNAQSTDGKLELVHRDIKPDNLQITAHGEVKVLDFGIAKARFAERESNTTAHLHGTQGYMAPERFLGGKDGPAGDVFSLGVVLHELVTGVRAGPYDEDYDTALTDPVLGLARSMASIEVKGRPGARRVEDNCTELLRSLQGPTLRAWSETAVPPLIQLKTTDPLVGRVLEEGDGPGVQTAVSSDVGTGEHSGTSTRLWLLTGSTLLLFLLGAAGVASVALAAGAWWYMSSADPELAVVPDPAPDVEPEAPDVDAEPTEEPDPTPPDPTPPDPTPPDPTPPAAPAPRPKPAPAPAPAPVVEERPRFTVILSSKPIGAQLVIDGQSKGVTPWTGELTEGPHEIVMSDGTASATRTVQVGALLPKRFVWKGADYWQVMP